MGYILATGYQYKKSCRAFLRLPGYWQPFIVVFGLALHHARGDVEAATAHARRHPPSKNAHRLDEDAAYAPTRAARENERKRARSCARHLLCSRNVVLNTRSRLATSRATPAALVRCPAPLTGRGRSPLSPRPPLVNPTRRHFSSPRHAAPLTARSCPRRGRWGPPWAPPPASPAGSQ